MGAVTDISQLAEPINDVEVRIAKLVADVDAIAVILPRAFAKSRLETLKMLAQDVATGSQAIKLAIKLERPAAEIVEILEEFRATLARLRLMSSRTRVEQGTMLSLVFIEDLAKGLLSDLLAWQALS